MPSTSSQFLAALAVLTTSLLSSGCGPTSTPPAAGTGTTNSKSSDQDLSKSMTREEAASYKPKIEAHAHVAEDANLNDLLLVLTNPMTGAKAKPSVAGKRIPMRGTVLEVKPEEADGPVAVLDGGNANGQIIKVKCVFAAADKEAVAKLKPGETIRAEGVSDAEIKDSVLEFKECKLLPPAENNPPAAAPPAK